MNKLSKYNILKETFNTGDLVEFKTNTKAGWIIRQFTGYHVDYSAMIVKFYFDNCDQRYCIMEVNNNSIELNLLSKRLEKFNGNVWISRLDTLYSGYRSRLKNWAFSRLGMPYNSISTVKRILSKISIDFERCFNSKLYQTALECNGIICVDSHMRVWPGEFHSYGILSTPVRII